MKLCHVSISVRSLEESLQFYQDMIGLPVKSRSFVRHGLEIAFLGNSETEIELICNQDHTNVFVGPDISLGFAVASVQETMNFLRQKGIATGEVSQPNPRTKFFFVSDPNGVKIQFIERVK